LAPWALPAAHAQPAGAQLDQSLAKTAGAFVPGRVLVGWNDLANTENAVASMRRQGWTVLRTLDPLPVALVEVPAGKAVNLAESGYHLMLLGLKKPLQAGESVPLTLNITTGKKTRKIDVQVEVKPLVEAQPHAGHAEHMHHH
jgi:hypothetical protein